MQYMVGGLLYMPAYQENIVRKIKENSFKNLTSISFCLEDAINDRELDEAEYILKENLRILKNINNKQKLPLLFVRIRTPEHLRRFHQYIEDNRDVLSGYIFPKVDLNNVEEYMDVLTDINQESSHKFYGMPILESESISYIKSRHIVLDKLKEIFDQNKEYILNIRVGGNDLSNLYGLRRPVNYPIYSVGVVRDILIDILNVFATEYVVSGPVWNYFGDFQDKEWSRGLVKELELDRLNGFIGKTAIHPVQLPYIYDSLKVSKIDYEDAKKILNWNDNKAGVKKGVNGTRMNEVKIHRKWAEKIIALAEIYGQK